MYYYRLKQIDKDGQFTYSPIIAISVTALSFVSYSLVQQDLWYLYLSGQQKNMPYSCQLYDVHGQLVKNIAEVQFPHNYFNISNLLKGVYMYEIKAGEKVVATGKVLF